RDLSWPNIKEAGILLFVAWSVILVSFWASTMAANAIRAALTTMAAFTFGGGWIAVGLWGSAGLSDRHGGFQSGFLTWIMVHRQLSPDDIAEMGYRYLQAGVWFATTIVVVMLLSQSLAQFRRTHTRRETVMKYSLMLIVLVVGCTIWCGDLVSSIQ